MIHDFDSDRTQLDAGICRGCVMKEETRHTKIAASRRHTIVKLNADYRIKTGPKNIQRNCPRHSRNMRFGVIFFCDFTQLSAGDHENE